MANLAAKDPSYCGPDVATRWTPERPGPGRPPTKWLRAKIDEVDPDTGKSKRDLIAEHLIELATSYTVIHMGRDLELASGRDSVEAAKVLFSYVYGKPGDDPATHLLKLAEHLRSVARDQVEIGRGFLGKRQETMSGDELAAFWKLCERDPQQFIAAAIGALAMASGDVPPPPAQISASLPADPTTAQPNTGNGASPPEAGAIPGQEAPK
jgi:hypothetical protein